VTVKNNIKLIVSAIIVTIALMFALAIVAVTSTQSVSAISDTNGARHSAHIVVKGITDPNQKSIDSNNSNEANYFKDILLPVVATIIAVLAIIWNVVDYLKRRSGYLKLQLECKFECSGDRKYIVSKTSLDNTSTKPIYVAHTFLIMIGQNIDIDRERELVDNTYDEMSRLLKDYNGRYRRNVVDDGRSKAILIRLFECIKEDKERWGNSRTSRVPKDDFIFKYLPYFTTLHARLGSLAHMSTSHIQEIKNNGIYSVYFITVGEEWYKGDSVSRATYARTIHDEVLVK